MSTRNRLKYWRHQHGMNQKEFAEYLMQPYHHYTRWDGNVVQPSVKKLVDMWKVIKKRFPDTNLQDLLEL